MTDTETYLAHHGILGMKWGRRLPESDREESQKHLAHPDHSSAHELAKNPTRHLSNAELQKINQRLQLETQYSKLKGQQSTIKKGHETVKTVLAIGGSVGAAYTLGSKTAVFLKSPAGQKAVAKGASILTKIAKLAGK